jgi:hypothetical protein
VKYYLAVAVALLFGTLASSNVKAQRSSKNSEAAQHEESLTAVVFLATDCPISQKYIGELKNIDSLFHAKVSVKGVIPGKVRKEELEQFISEYQIDFPVVTDADYTLVKKYRATITPEVFLINSKNHVYYQGAIDNWFFDLGKYRQHITEHYLIDAIKAVLEGQSPVVKKTESVGCPIQKTVSKKSVSTASDL